MTSWEDSELKFTVPVQAKVLEQLKLTSEQKHYIEDLNQKYESQLKKLTHSLQEGSNNFQMIMNVTAGFQQKNVNLCKFLVKY